MEVIVDGRVLTLGSLLQRLVLALLLIRAPEPLSRDRMIDELWGERPPATAAHAVQVYVSGIRKALRAAAQVEVRSVGLGYSIEIDPDLIDARRFERFIDLGQRALAVDPSRARACFDDALGLWRGQPLAEFEQSELAALEASRLEELHTLAVEGVVEARLGRGDSGEVISRSPVWSRPIRYASGHAGS
jgi:DNA-binding SARP family transcriptional activator